MVMHGKHIWQHCLFKYNAATASDRVKYTLLLTMWDAPPPLCEIGQLRISVAARWRPGDDGYTLTNALSEKQYLTFSNVSL
jgi:hypothetical protein